MAAEFGRRSSFTLATAQPLTDFKSPMPKAHAALEDYSTPLEKLPFEEYPAFEEEEAGEEDFQPEEQNAGSDAAEEEEELALEQDTEEAATEATAELELLAKEEQEADKVLGPRKSLRKKQNIERLKPNQAVDTATMKAICKIARAAGKKKGDAMAEQLQKEIQEHEAADSK